jgi:hypothetical protein
MIYTSGEDPPEVTVLDGVSPRAHRARLLRVHASGPRPSIRIGKIFLRSKTDVPETFLLRYAITVTGNVTVSPSRAVFNLHAPGPQTQVLTVRSRQANFAVLSATIDEGPFVASLEHPGSQGEARIRVGLRVEKRADPDRNVFGRLIVRSNDSTEPRKEISLSALGKLENVSSDAPESD